MSTPAPFSRLQLAAALLEYDNDPDNPDAPYRSAKDSAIFAHLRRNPAARPDGPSRRSDYMGVSGPSEMGSLGGRESALDTRKSRASRISTLRNPFGPDNASDFEEGEDEEEGGEEEGLEVDLASWGLDAFIPKEKPKSAKSKGKQAVSAVGSPRSRLSSINHDSSVATPRRGLVTSASVSLNNYTGGFKRDNPEQLDRRRSFGSPLELAGAEQSILPHRRAASQASMLTPSNSAMVPFPTARTPSPGPEDAFAEPKYKEHGRINSMASMNSRPIMNEGGEELPHRQRNVSNDTLTMSNPIEDNPFAIQHSSHTSRFDPKSTARQRSHSNASMGSRMMLENDNMSVLIGDPYMRERRYSTLELLRPKVLVMPSPLQPPSSRGGPDHKVRDGFELSADGPPLPPGARSSRRLSATFSTFEKGGNVPIASNSFIPNPLTDLSLSQKTFRNTLDVGGQSGGSTLPRATEDGEQAELDPREKEEQPEISLPQEEHSKASRPAGKLYGKSLIDDLENRKAQMRSKQRVFTGDQRPSMMAREQQRSSTLIDPVSLQLKPSAQHLSSYGPQNTQQGLARQSSLTLKPLLNFDEEGNKPLQPSPVANRVPAARSVFGVDTLWEREMAKLKEMQANEEKEREEMRRKEEQEELKKQKKKDKRKKKNVKSGQSELNLPEVAVEAYVPAEPPMLPAIQRAPRRDPPKPSDSDESPESDEDNSPIPIPAAGKTPSWHVGSSDEDEDKLRRTTGTGLRYPKRTKSSIPAGEDSEEDLPLVATIHKAQVRATMGSQNHALDSDDEDRPLSHLLQRSYSNSMSGKANPIPANRSRESDEDDNQPLGLRASRIAANDEDDLPLAFHPEQQRRTQYQILAQQQQQMMLQAQMQSNMLMNASLLSSSFYPPPVMNPLAMIQMQVPVPIPSPPIQDEAKFGLVDRWRRDVATEGENE